MSELQHESENEDYEDITYYTFKGVGYQRVLRWKAGSRSYIMSNGDSTKYDVDMICIDTPQYQIEQPDQSQPQQSLQPPPQISYQLQPQPNYEVSYQQPQWLAVQQAGNPMQYAVVWSGQHTATVQDTGVEEGEDEDEDDEEEDDDDDCDDDNEGEENDEDEDDYEQDEYIQVNLIVKKHILRDDEYLFHDIRNTVRSTKKNEWERVITANGRSGWVYKGSMTKYIAYKMPR